MIGNACPRSLGGLSVVVERGVELRQLETFVAVAEETGFGRAGERLHVVQSAVSATAGKDHPPAGVLRHKSSDV
jgi:Bacterial regulatory helix-turn-helix protein, lysR family